MYSGNQRLAHLINLFTFSLIGKTYPVISRIWKKKRGLLKLQDISRFSLFLSTHFTDPYKLEIEALARSCSSLPFLPSYKAHFIKVYSSLAILCCFNHANFQSPTDGISIPSLRFPLQQNKAKRNTAQKYIRMLSMIFTTFLS